MRYIWVIALLVLSSLVYADTEITGCVDIIAPDTYFLSGNLVGTIGAREDCIDIQSTGVTIDCQGFQLSTDTTPPRSYIHNGPYAGNFIRNCSIATTGASITHVMDTYQTLWVQIRNFGDDFVDPITGNRVMYVANVGGVDSYNISNPAYPEWKGGWGNTRCNFDFLIDRDLSNPGGYIGLCAGQQWGSSTPGYIYSYNLSHGYVIGAPWSIFVPQQLDSISPWAEPSSFAIDPVNNRVAFWTTTADVYDYTDARNLVAGTTIFSTGVSTTVMDISSDPLNYIMATELGYVWKIRRDNLSYLYGLQTFVPGTSTRLHIESGLMKDGYLFADGCYSFTVINMSEDVPAAVAFTQVKDPYQPQCESLLDRNSKMANYNDYMIGQMGFKNLTFYDISNPLKPRIVLSMTDPKYNGPDQWYTTKVVGDYLYYNWNRSSNVISVYNLTAIGLGIGIHSDTGDISISSNKITGDGEYGIRIDAIADTASLQVTQNNVSLADGAAFTLNYDGCPTNIDVYNNNFIGQDSLFGHTDCNNKTMNISTYRAYGNYYGTCTDGNSDGFCDSAYSNPYWSTWIDSYALSGEFEPLTCIPDWDCTSYSSCTIAGRQSCLAVEDDNSCGEPFTGDLADYARSCTYRGGTGTWASEPATEQASLEIPELPLAPLDWTKAFEEFKLIFQNIIAFGLTRENIESLISAIGDRWLLILILVGIAYAVYYIFKGKRRRRR